MATLSFSEIYNLFKLDEMRDIVKECLVRLGMSEINFLSSDEGAILEASRKEFTIRITLTEEKIGEEGSGFFQGQPRVKIEALASSENEKNLAESIDELKYCILIRAARGGG